MAGTRPRLSNDAARRVFLARHALDGTAPPGPPKAATRALVDRLGFVQVDSINTVARAHDMILATRARPYRPSHLKTLLERDRALWEHWTHDAAILPVWTYPYWRLRFRRDRERLRARWRDWHGAAFEGQLDRVLGQIADQGPVMARTVGPDEERRAGGWWDWHPSKTALEFLWRTGRLAVAGRQGFQKVFDLTERVIPEDVRTLDLAEAEIVDWACRTALDRLGFATPGEIAAFWDLIGHREAKTWAAARRDLIEIDVEGADGRLRTHLAWPGLLDEAAALPDPPGAVRVLSPFDPSLRDRARAERLFGFHYRIEVFVPAGRRRFGYYVFPLLEGTRLIGRVDMKRNPETGALEVRALWPERGVRLGKGRMARIDAALGRTARASGCADVVWLAGWRRDPV